MTRQEALHYRALIDAIIDKLTDEDAFESTELFHPWKTGKQYYGPPATENDPPQSRIRYNESLYKCLQTHTSQEGWEPGIAVSLWYEIPDPAEEWPEWVQPIGAGTGYALGAKVSHNNKHWINIGKDDNEYEPGVWGWDEVVEA